MWSSYSLQLCSVLLSLISSAFTGEQPLIFNPYNEEIYNVRGFTELIKNNANRYAAACPATENQQEIDFNEKFSHGGKSLIMRDTSDKQYEDMLKTECKDGFQLSLVTIRPDSSKGKGKEKEVAYLFSLGYEVYVNLSQYPDEKFAFTPYNAIGSITKAMERPFLAWILSPLKRLWSKKDEPTIVKKGFDTEEKQEMDLIWLGQIRIRYDVSSWSVIRSNYKLYRNADQIRAQVKCNKYDLGSEIYQEKDQPIELDDFYKPHNQDRIFTKFKLPPSIKPNGDCNLYSVCIKKYDGVPAYALQASSSAEVSCTNLTSIPIWDEVSGPLLEYLDKFLLAIAQVSDNRLTVITGTSGILQLRTRDDENLENIYLYPEQVKLPVPKIVFKIAMYQSLGCNQQQDKLCAFEIAFVIHNDPDFEDKDKLCHDACALWGWDSIQYQSTTDKKPIKKSRHIYCCRVDEEFLDKIQWKSHEKTYEGMNLRRFPYFNKYIGHDLFVNKQNEFENVMEKLFPSDESAKTDWNSIPNLTFDGNPNQEGSSSQSNKLVVLPVE